jgi:hypothetical protein
MPDSRRRESLAVETLKLLGLKKISEENLALLLNSFCKVASQEKQRCIDHVRYCEKRIGSNRPGLAHADPALVARIVAESLEADLA